MGVGVQVPPRTHFVSYKYGKSALNSIREGFLDLLISIGHRVDVLNLSYGGNGEYPIAVLCRGVSPWCSCGASTGRSQKSMTHSAGSRLWQPVSLAGRLLATGRAARVGWRVARAAFGLLVPRSGHGGSPA